MPFISLNKKVDTSYYHYHKNFSDDDFNHLCEEIGKSAEKVKFEKKKKI